MGCGESKHAIATESTISQSKRSNSKKSIQGKATADDVLVPKSTQEESGNLVAEPGIGNSIVKESGNAEKVSGDDNVKEAAKVDKIIEKQVDQSTKGDNDDVKESVDQPKGESMVENVKDGDKEEASPAAANDGNVKEAEKLDQILEEQGDQNLKGEDVKESVDQPKGESVVENVKEDGNKEASPAAINGEPVVENDVTEDENKQAASAAEAIVVDEVKAGDEEKEVKEEISIKSNEESAAKEKEDAKLPQPDEAMTDASEKKTDADADEVVKEKESTKEIEIEAKNDEVVEDPKEINETVQSAEAKDSTHNAEEKIPSAKEEIKIESAEADKKAD